VTLIAPSLIGRVFPPAFAVVDPIEVAKFKAAIALANPVHFNEVMGGLADVAVLGRGCRRRLFSVYGLGYRRSFPFWKASA
jgi:hypothetical protein